MGKASKGSAFERSCCHTLSEWWTQDLKEPRSDIFWRTSGSGARATTRRKGGNKTANSHGDIMALDPIGQPFLDVFTVEIKRGYSRSTIVDMLDKPKGAATQVYESWIQQAIASQQAAGSLYWLLVIKRDKREPLVFYDSGLISDAEIDNLALFYFSESFIVGCTVLTEFLKTLSPITVKRLARET